MSLIDCLLLSGLQTLKAQHCIQVQHTEHQPEHHDLATLASIDIHLASQVNQPVGQTTP
jgi:hypothetical protein